jgi:hypothetical protein
VFVCEEGAGLQVTVTQDGSHHELGNKSFWQRLLLEELEEGQK